MYPSFWGQVTDVHESIFSECGYMLHMKFICKVILILAQSKFKDYGHQYKNG